MKKRSKLAKILKKSDIAKKDIDGLSEAEKRTLLQMSEISIILDNYDDLFSDFDPRPYTQRTLSDDFLSEIKKASKEKTSGRIELKLIIPIVMRNFQHEAMIKKRIRGYFKKHYALELKDTTKIIHKGILSALLGFALMIAATYLSRLENVSFILDMVRIMMEPAGWFMVWYGLDHLFYNVKDREQEKTFLKKMQKCHIYFSPY